MELLLNLLVGKKGIVGKALVLCMMMFLGSFARAANDDFYKDTPENHKRFSDAMKLFVSPSIIKGIPEDSLRVQFAEAAVVLSHYKFKDVSKAVEIAMLTELSYLSDLEKTNALTNESVRLWFFENVLNIFKDIGIRTDRSVIQLLQTSLMSTKDALGLGDGESAAFDAVIKQAEDLHDHLLEMQSTIDREVSIYNAHNELQLAKGAQFIKRPTPNLSLLQVKDFNYETARERGMVWIDEVRRRMSQTLKGQPEVLDALVMIEHERILGKPREMPRLRWLMGLPGTGKDTSAEAYVDAIHGYEFAHEDHMFRLSPARTDADAWKYFGSGTGYVGSDKVSELIRFLVKHSGGRYAIREVQGAGSGKVEQVYETGKVTPDNTPDSAVLFVNELHNWSREAIDVILKEALEKGSFPIGSPNGGLARIKVPVTIMIASNDGMELLVPKGHISGRSLTYDEMMEMYEDVSNDKKRLKESIIEKNTIRHGEVRDTKAGISPEVLNRIDDEDLFLMRPLDKAVLTEIATQKLQEIADEFEYASSILGPTTFKVTQNTAEKIEEFNRKPEEGARPMRGKVRGMVRNIITSAIVDKKLGMSEEPREITVDIVVNADKTWSLSLTSHSQTTGEQIGQPILLPIPVTESLRDKEPLSDEKILKLREFEESLGNDIVGAHRIAGALKEALLTVENANQSGGDGKAQSFLFLGLSSTGKTQTAKAVANFLYGSEDDLVIIDFNGLVSEYEVRKLIFGEPNGPKSPFMEAYDRKKGRVIFLFDEIANVAAPNILTPLYQVLDEANVTQFNDGKPRSMAGVTIINTGNAGEEIYNAIPRNIPERVQRAAAQEVYDNFIENYHLRRSLLERKFRQAFLNRIGDERTIFFSPLDFTGVRELIQIKLKGAFKFLAEKNGRLYDVKIKDEATYEKLLTVLENEGFRLWEQGRSIDRIVTMLQTRLTSVLELEGLVPSGARVVLEYDKRITEGKDEKKKSKELFKVWVEGRSTPLTLVIDALPDNEDPKTRVENQLSTAFHEAGHEILRAALMQDLTSPKRISIIPGVAEIAGEMVYYAGVAGHKVISEASYTEEYMLSRMAQLLAGGAAERLISKGHKSTGGQSNDLERANFLAKTMIIKFGLSKAWGLEAPESHQSPKDYIDGLSAEKREKLEKIVNAYMVKAAKLADEVLAINYETFIKMGVMLAKRGDVHEEELVAFYKENPVKDYWAMNPLSRKLSKFNSPYIRTWLNGLRPYYGRDQELVPSVPKLKDSEVANIDEILEKQHQEAIKKARVIKPSPVLKPGDCESFFKRNDAA